MPTGARLFKRPFAVRRAFALLEMTQHTHIVSMI
jgi:hypothetical protein